MYCATVMWLPGMTTHEIFQCNVEILPHRRPGVPLRPFAHLPVTSELRRNRYAGTA